MRFRWLKEGFLVAEFRSPKKVHTCSSTGDHCIPKSVKCTHSDGSIRGLLGNVAPRFWGGGGPRLKGKLAGVSRDLRHTVLRGRGTTGPP